jgi:YbbR domain-containing protein
MALRDYIVNHFWWKLLSLLLAALAWLTINTMLQKEESLQTSPVVTSSTRSFAMVPVTLLTSPFNTNRFRTYPETVSVDIGGTAGDLQKLQPGQIQAFVNVADAGEEKQFRKPIQIQVPKDFAVMSMTPTNASVERITSSAK